MRYGESLSFSEMFTWSKINSGLVGFPETVFLIFDREPVEICPFVFPGLYFRKKLI